MHSDDKIDGSSGELQKPEVITFYNATKGGVDVVDEMKTLYSTARISCRWSLTVFFGLMNIGGINAQIIFHKNSGQSIQRRVFLKDLAFALMRPHILQREMDSNLSLELCTLMRNITGTADTRKEVAEGFCAKCPRRKNRKTKKYCATCAKPVCNEHAIFLCNDCFEKEED